MTDDELAPIRAELDALDHYALAAAAASTNAEMAAKAAVVAAQAAVTAAALRIPEHLATLRDLLGIASPWPPAPDAQL